MVTLLVCSATIYGCGDVEPPLAPAKSEKASPVPSDPKGDEKTVIANLNLEEPSEMVEDSSELVIGDPAPMIVISKWINGEPVTAYVPEKVYIVEFWATWCGPCLKSMPHIASLQAEYGDSVTIVGVTAEDDATVSKFMTDLAGQGDKTWSDVLTYRIATDDDGKTNGRAASSYFIGNCASFADSARLHQLGPDRGRDAREGSSRLRIVLGLFHNGRPGRGQVSQNGRVGVAIGTAFARL